MLQDNIKGEGGGIDFLKPLLFDNFSDENFFLNKVELSIIIFKIS